MRTSAKFAAFLSLLFAALLAPPVASACYFSCFWENNCGECRYAGFYTGGDCEEPVPCICNFVQAWCGGAAVEESAAAPDFLAAPEETQCTAPSLDQ